MVLIKIKHLLKFPEIDHIVDMTESLIDMKQKGGEVEATTVKVKCTNTHEAHNGNSRRDSFYVLLYAKY